MKTPRIREELCAASLFLLVLFLGADVARAQSPSPEESAKPYPGYTLFSIETTAYLYDMDKQLVHSWEVEEGSVKTTPYLLADGSVLFPLNKGGFTFKPGGAHASGTFQRVSWDGELLWDFSFYGEDFTPSYDVEPMPNGNILVCAGFEDRRRPGKLFEVRPTGKTEGEVIWECNVSEALGDGVKGYINSVSYNPDADQVLVNIQTPGHTLAIFDHSSADAELVFLWDEGFTGRIHGGVWVTDKYRGTDITIPGADENKMGAGNIITVSNEDNQVVEVDPRTHSQVRTIDYEFSDHQGGVQRLPNGNTLIVSGYSNTITELDAEGNVVWSMETADRIARAYRYSLDHPGVARLKKE
ncbi:MAG: aryl-sulfate sulfotransferase [Planctomycetota bacterium]|jgi:hypothetical protein